MFSAASSMTTSINTSITPCQNAFKTAESRVMKFYKYIKAKEIIGFTCTLEALEHSYLSPWQVSMWKQYRDSPSSLVKDGRGPTSVISESRVESWGLKSGFFLKKIPLAINPLPSFQWYQMLMEEYWNSTMNSIWQSFNLHMICTQEKKNNSWIILPTSVAP